MDDQTKSLLLHHLVPGLGCLVALAMFSSPLTAVLTVRRQKRLGDFNPLPLIAIIGNCIGWLVYGCIRRDPYVIASNEPGLMLGLFMSLSCYGFADARVRDQMVASLLFFALLISSACIYIALGVTAQPAQQELAGYLAVIILLIYYAAPLSTLVKVVSERSSASLHLPLSIMSCVNGSLWVAYGLDMFIWGPNAAGAVLGAVQLLLIATYPAKLDSHEKGEAETDELLAGGRSVEDG